MLLLLLSPIIPPFFIFHFLFLFSLLPCLCIGQLLSNKLAEAIVWKVPFRPKLGSGHKGFLIRINAQETKVSSRNRCLVNIQRRSRLSASNIPHDVALLSVWKFVQLDVDLVDRILQRLNPRATLPRDLSQILASRCSIVIIFTLNFLEENNFDTVPKCIDIFGIFIFLNL